MRLTFQLRFHTIPGQSLFLVGNHRILGGDQAMTALPLHYVDDQCWRATLDLEAGDIPNADITYRYVLRQPDGTLLEDWGNGRTINPSSFEAQEVVIIDSWNHPGFFENAFYTEPFRKVLLRPWQTEFQLPRPEVITHQFKIKAPLLQRDQTLCLIGSNSALGNWDTSRPVLMNRSRNQDWLTAELDLTNEPFPVEYKYGVYDISQKKFVSYEEGANRTLKDSITSTKQTVVNDGFVRLPSTGWKGAGVAIPVFSLRSQSSFGVGEFTDLKLLADWCHRADLKLIQILPVNDTSATHTASDSYPYAAISAFALHPLYLNLSQVASKTNKPLLQTVEEERKRLNGLKDLDYAEVMQKKLEFARQLYGAQGKSTFKSQDFKKFFKENEHWLVPYAGFCYFRDKYGTPDFNRWETNKACDRKTLASLATEGSEAWDEIGLIYFIQYHLHSQLKEATEYAHSKGVILKGDIAIGVYRCGADAWQEPQLYRMEMQAGAPPDAFGIKGQNWSFPTYDWSRMKETDFGWWKQRFAQMGVYFDAFRIDHILGFFRIWSIPLDAVEGIMGHFVPAIPVHIDEFRQRGIAFDYSRFARPFITASVLSGIFGAENLEKIKREFLNEAASGRYALKSEYATQRQVEAHFATLAQTPENAKLQEGVYDLISNVILLDDEQRPGELFHFRFSMETTLSFQNLDSFTQSQLRDLYVDYFFRRQDDFWMREAMQKLPSLKRVTNMLVCGEDLGMVPACVPEAMKQMGLLSLEVQRMPKRLNQEFSSPGNAPYLSVVTPSTHDMSTIRGWWQEDRSVTQRFFNHELGIAGAAPVECEPWINRAIIDQHLASPAMWSIFQMQDLLGMDQHLRRPTPSEERINVPADAKNYWKYRMHLWLEDLLKATEFNSFLKEEIVKNRR